MLFFSMSPNHILPLLLLGTPAGASLIKLPGCVLMETLSMKRGREPRLGAYYKVAPHIDCFVFRIKVQNPCI